MRAVVLLVALEVCLSAVAVAEADAAQLRPWRATPEAIRDQVAALSATDPSARALAACRLRSMGQRAEEAVPALMRLLGALPKNNEAIARKASPVFQVDPSDPPLLLLHGDQDPQMPINQSHELEGAYERQGLEAGLVVVHGAVHGGDAFYAPHNIERVAAFLDEHLRR